MTDENKTNDDCIKKASEKIINSLSEFGFELVNKKEECLYKLTNYFESAQQGEIIRPYIGSNASFHNNINMYDPNYGVRYFLNKPLKTEIHFGNLKKLGKLKKLYILATTGQSLIHVLTNASDNYIGDLLRCGADVIILIPNKHSTFCNNVAEIEDRSVESFSNQFKGVIDDLIATINSFDKANNGTMGRILIGCCYNLLRQTIVMGINDEDEAYGWMSLTMPPSRTAGDSPNITFSGNIKDVKSICKTIYSHLNEIENLANRHNHLFVMDGHDDFKYGFYFEEESAKIYWKELYNIAKNRMYDCDGDRSLIEVAAQHPLKNGDKPSKEFAIRLDAAIELYKKIVDNGGSADIYVPGSRHSHNGIDDKISLSKAGFFYLKERGIPEECILGEKENEKYKGENGVYNSADECFVASEIFSNGDYGQLYCVCSSNQLLRKKLFYIAFGVIPRYYTADSSILSHDDMYEIFEAIPDVILNDHTWQEKNSVNGNRTRNERTPKDINSSI